ncbi:hypothetical protein HAX54_008785, partial [Datura stramonium]|nr:hypothetical protein [Datura stramonium]
MELLCESILQLMGRVLNTHHIESRRWKRIKFLQNKWSGTVLWLLPSQIYGMQTTRMATVVLFRLEETSMTGPLESIHKLLEITKLVSLVDSRMTVCCGKAVRKAFL